MLIVRTLIPELFPIHISSGGTRHWNENQHPKDLQWSLAFCNPNTAQGCLKEQGCSLKEEMYIDSVPKGGKILKPLYPSMSLGTWKCFDIKKKKIKFSMATKLPCQKHNLNLHKQASQTYTEWGRRTKISSSDWWMWLFANFYWW